MRSYNCFLYHKTKTGGLVKNSNDACYAGLKKWWNPEGNDWNSRPNDWANDPYVYIHKFREPETVQYIPLIIRLVRKITPCKIVKIDGAEYIKIKILDTYDQTLVLFNFVRYLWCAATFIGWKDGLDKFTSVFFETLKKATNMREPLERLLYANKEACRVIDYNGYAGHSNIGPHAELAIKNTQQLFAYRGNTTSGFLGM